MFKINKGNEPIKENKIDSEDKVVILKNQERDNECINIEISRIKA
jgi:hypothetical protein